MLTQESHPCFMNIPYCHSSDLLFSFSTLCCSLLLHLLHLFINHPNSPQLSSSSSHSCFFTPRWSSAWQLIRVFSFEDVSSWYREMRADAGVIVHSEHTKGSCSPDSYTGWLDNTHSSCAVFFSFSPLYVYLTVFLSLAPQVHHPSITTLTLSAFDTGIWRVLS